MSDEKSCLKTDLLDDMRNRIERLEVHDREYFGTWKELSQTIKDIGGILNEVKVNLVNLNKKNEDTNMKIDNLEDKVYTKIDDLEQQINNQNIADIKSNSIDMREILKSVIMKFILPVGGIAAIGAWILKLINVI